MRIALVGLGQTGKIVADYLLDKQELILPLCRKGSEAAHQDIGVFLNRPPCDINVETLDHLEAKLFMHKPDVLLDFSSPQFLREHIFTLARCGVHIVTAVTGYDPVDVEKIRNVAQSGRIGVLFAPNITHGVNVLIHLVGIAAQLMHDYDFEIVEEQHRYKKDKPSGTAKKIAAKIMETWLQQQSLPLDNESPIPIHSIRSGGIIGTHKVLISSEFDQIEITHQAFSRKAYAEGAYKAAQFIYNKTGYYEMNDVFYTSYQPPSAPLPPDEEPLPLLAQAVIPNI